MKTDLVKGFKDYSGKDSGIREEIKKILVDTFEKYNFEPAETPLIEYEDFVKSGDSQDEAISDIYKLKDKGKRKLALRYEFTFQLKRLMKNKKLPYRRYQIGPVFRDEPVAANRFRQITMCDADVIGSSIKDEAENMFIIKKVLDTLGIKFTIYFNNRKLLNEILDELKIKNKAEVIREIDKLDKLPEKVIAGNLKKLKAEKILKVLKNPEAFFKKYPSYKEIEDLKRGCKWYGVKLVFSPFLARGLSYYNGTIFEVKTKEIRETIASGGSYFFNNTQCTGISFGLDRLTSLAKINLDKEKYLIISLNQERDAIRIAKKLRDEGKIAAVFYGKPSKALDYANSYKISQVIFIGQKEIESGKYKVKDMKSGREKTLSL